MPKWFVYSNESYYPWAEVVEAETAEQAAESFFESVTAEGFHGLAVFPLDALAYWTCGLTETGTDRPQTIEEALGR